MAARNRLADINLAPKDEFEKSFLGKSLRWVLTAGRTIVILTEFVVILAFLSRFKLDRDLNDLNEVVTQKQAVVESFAEVEQQMRDLLGRMTIVERARGITINSVDSLNSLVSKTPRDVSFESVDISQNEWSIKGVAGSEAGFARFLAEIRSDDDFSQVNLGEVSFNQRRGGVVFDLQARRRAVEGGVNKQESETDE